MQRDFDEIHFSIPDGVNKKTKEAQPQEGIQVKRGDLIEYFDDWHKYISIAKSTHLTKPGYRRFGKILQGVDYVYKLKDCDKITNCGLIFNKYH